MKRRIKLKRKVFHSKKIKKSNLILLIFILIMISIMLTFRYINIKTKPVLTSYAEMEIKKIATSVISSTINEELSKNLNTESLFIINKDADSKIETIDFNTVIVNNILVAAVTSIQANLTYLSKGELEKLTVDLDNLAGYDMEKLRNGIFYEIPMGAVFNNSFLSNLGPKIPVKYNLVGSITSNLDSSIKNYGINSALIETNININVTIRVILPLAVKDINVNSILPISMKIISGEIPKYYINGFNQSSPILSLPVE